MRPGCEEFRRRWPLAEERDAADFEALDRHREVCADCAAWQVRHDPLSMFGVLAEAPPQAPSFWAGFGDAVRAGVAVTAPPGAAGRRSMWGLATAAALIVGAGLAALVTLDLGPGDVPGPPVTTELPTVETLRSPEARMVDLRVFDEEEEEVTELVLIFDEGIDL